MGKTAKGCGLLKSKFSAKGHFLNIATQNTAGKKSRSYQCLLSGGEASCFDPASAAICHFSSLALLSVCSHLSRLSTLGQHSQAVGRTRRSQVQSSRHCCWKIFHLPKCALIHHLLQAEQKMDYNCNSY